MSPFLIRTLEFILAITILVALHEGGHFFFSKLFGVRVNKFFVFFDYKFKLFSTNFNWWRKLRGLPPQRRKRTAVMNMTARNTASVGFLLAAIAR